MGWLVWAVMRARGMSWMSCCDVRDDLWAGRRLDDIEEFGGDAVVDVYVWWERT